MGFWLDTGLMGSGPADPSTNFQSASRRPCTVILTGKEPRVKRKRYSRQIQRKAVEHMRTCEGPGKFAQELGVTRRCLCK